MLDILLGAGPFKYPLFVCSLLAAYIVCERFYALRRLAIIPPDTVHDVLDGKPVGAEAQSSLARIVRFAEDPAHDDDAVKAYARMEINRMERGFVILEIIVGVAPMIGLMGTVYSLISVFGVFHGSAETGNRDQLMAGISLALSTTFIGLAVAIPSLFCSSILQRRVETYAVQIDALLERIQAQCKRRAESLPAV